MVGLTFISIQYLKTQLVIQLLRHNYIKTQLLIKLLKHNYIKTQLLTLNRILSILKPT